jgi:hypothetical protein
MSRWLILSLLTLALVACKSSDKPPPAPTSGSGSGAQVAGAGKVLEVSGQVSIGGKPAAVGAVVAADDVVTTGSDGRIMIELAHNLAHWQLGPNKQQKVADSIAWKLPRDEGNTKIVIQDMTSAGRPAERSAAETDKTVAAPAAAAEQVAPPPPPPAPPARAVQSAPGGGRKAASAPPMPEAQPAPMEEKEEESDREASPRTRGPVKKASGANTAALEAALRKCVTGKPVSVHIYLANGTVTWEIKGEVSPTERACLDKAAAATTASPGLDATIQLK